MDSENEARRLLYVCVAPPSNLSGAASILRNLFEGYPIDRLYLLVDDRHLAGARARGVEAPWQAETVKIPEGRGARELLRRLLKSRRSESVASGGQTDQPASEGSDIHGRLRRWAWHADSIIELVWVPVIAARAIRMMRRHHLEGIFAVQGGPAYVLGAYLASLLSGAPLYVFSMDAWGGNDRYPSGVRAWVASFFEPRVLRRATVRWAISPFQAGEWQARYGVKSHVCWHSVDVGSFERAGGGHGNDSLTIAALGTVYSVNRKEFRRLCAAVAALRTGSHLDLTVCLYTTQTLDQLEAEGVHAIDWLRVRALEPAGVPGALTSAAALFLGLSFEPRWRHVGEVAFPTKLAEYMAAGRPILVNAPATSTAARYVREHRAGVVVDEPDVNALIEALRTILEDRSLSVALGEGARRVAELNHDRRLIVRRFRRQLDRTPSELGAATSEAASAAKT